MKYNQIAILTIIITLLFVCSLSTISAANKTIDNSTGISTGITNTGVGETLFLQPGKYNKTSDLGITINKNITIQGNGSTDSVIIDAKGANRIFILGNNLNVTFINITFINAYSTNSGGVICNTNSDTTITSINCTFNNNSATDGNSIYTYGSITVINSTFVNNKAWGSGATGAGNIFVSGISSTSVIIINSSFYNNTSRNHGVAIDIHNAGNNVITNCIFVGNRPVNAGGAIELQNCINSTITNCTFINNTAGTSGRAIEDSGIRTVIIDCNFINNTAASNGGSIYKFAGSLNVTDSNFTSNNATNGGGIFSTNSVVNIANSWFANNRASIGGGIYNNNTSNMSISGNTMSGNNASTLGNVIYNLGRMGVLNLTYINNSTWIVKNDSTVTLYAILTDDMGNLVTGQNITLYINGTLIGSLISIEGNVTITYTVIGNDGDLLPVYGSYAGIGNYPIIINKGQLKIRVLATNSTVNTPNTKVGQSINITGVATDENGGVLADVNLSIVIDGVTYTVTTNSLGEWSLDYTPSYDDSFVVKVTWAGNSTHYGFNNSTSFNVTKSATNSTITVTNDNVDQSMNITGVATDEDGDLLANTQLTVIVDGQTFTVTTDSESIWILNYIPDHEGLFDISVSWNGNSTHNGFTNTTTFSVPKIPANTTINAPNTKVKQSINITGVAYDENGDLLTNAELTITIDGENYTVITDEEGVWILAYTPQHSSVFNVNVNFAGNNTHLNFTNSTSFNVEKLNTSITINPQLTLKLVRKL